MKYDTSIVDSAITESLKYIAKDTYMSRLHKQLSSLQRLYSKTTTTIADSITELTSVIHRINEENYKKDFIINKDVFERIVETTDTILTTKDLLTDIEHHASISVKGLHRFLQMIATVHQHLVTALENIITKLSAYINTQAKQLAMFTNDVSVNSDYFTGLGNNLSVYVSRFKDSIRSIELFIKSTDVCIGNIHVLTSAISKHME